MQTALNDLWPTMNVSHRSLHDKAFQEYLKKTFREPGDQCFTYSCKNSLQGYGANFLQRHHFDLQLCSAQVWAYVSHQSRCGCRVPYRPCPVHHGFAWREASRLVRVAEAKGKPQYKYKLPLYMAAAMLPVYQCFSESSRL